MNIGLTGGIGCGKSTVVGLLREAGWGTMETDAVVRELLAGDAGLRAAIDARWGPAVFQGNGAVDRKAVAARVFQDPSELRWLESQLHPKVRRRWSAFLARSDGRHHLVEIPLLFEKRLETQFDLNVCIACPRNLVEERMVARGYTEVEIVRRIDQQMPLEEKIERADHLISNAGSLDFLKRQTMRFSKQITDVSDVP
jgi:dephospho-CoA kinase